MYIKLMFVYCLFIVCLLLLLLLLLLLYPGSTNKQNQKINNNSGRNDFSLHLMHLRSYYVQHFNPTLSDAARV